MIILLNTSGPTCALTLVDGDAMYEHEWEAGRDLARGLLDFLRNSLAQHHIGFHDISALGVFEGPGSFTGLRIGLTVINTLADSLKLPIVGARGVNWKKNACSRLNGGQNDVIVIPFYGSAANTSLPKK